MIFIVTIPYINKTKHAYVERQQHNFFRSNTWPQVKKKNLHSGFKICPSDLTELPTLFLHQLAPETILMNHEHRFISPN